MNLCDRISIVTTIHNAIAEIRVQDVAPNCSAVYNLRLYSIDLAENRLLPKSEEISLNIAHSSWRVFAVTEVECVDTGLLTPYMVVGPAINCASKLKSPFELCLYSFNNAYQPYLVCKYRIPPEIGPSVASSQFRITTGPLSVFCVANEIFVLSVEGKYRRYPTLMTNSKLLACWSTESWLFCYLLTGSADDRSFKTLIIDLTQSSMRECVGRLIPDVYAGVLTCLRLFSLELSADERGGRLIQISDVYACTSYSQLIHCINNGQLVDCLTLPFNDGIDVFEAENAAGSVLIVLSRANAVAVIKRDQFQVLWTLSDVENLLFGDFLPSGTTQTLFLPSVHSTASSSDDFDVLSLIDIHSRDDKCHFTSDRFLLTDFLHIHIDCWSPSSRNVQDLFAKDDGNEEDSAATIQDAISALRCRLSAGSAQLSAARLDYQFKLSLAADTLLRLTNQRTTNRVPPATLPLVNIIEGRLNKEGEKMSDSSCSLDGEDVSVKGIWQRTVKDCWIIGATVYNHTSRPIFQVNLLLVPHNASRRIDFTCKCCSHSFRAVPEKKQRKVFSDVEAHRDSASLFCRRRTKPLDRVLPSHTGHAITSSSLLSNDTVVYGNVTYKLVLTWREGGSSRISYRSCGSVSLDASTLLKQDLKLPLQPDWSITDDLQLQFRLSLEAWNSVGRDVVMFSACQSPASVIDDRLSTMYSALTVRYQFVGFTNTVGCLVCLADNSPLEMCCLEAFSVGHFNSVKLRLSARNVNQLLLLIRTLYDCASDDVIIVPANQSKLRKTACCAIQSLCSEVSTSSRRTPVSYMEKIEQSIQTDKDVLRMLEQLH